MTTTLGLPNSGWSVIGSGLEDVERGAGDLAGLDRVGERDVVEQLTARAVDDADAVLHLRERLGVEPVLGLGRLGQVDRDDVGALVDVGGASRPSRRPSRGSARPPRTGRTRSRSCRGPSRARRRAGRSGRSRGRRASSRRSRCRRTWSAPSGPRRARACACGTLRTSDIISAIVCSAAVTMFDVGALATTMPRRVAAGTSTLSTPMPARPITFIRSARSIRSAVSVVAERIRIAS